MACHCALQDALEHFDCKLGLLNVNWRGEFNFIHASIMHSTGDRRSGQRQVAEAVAARLGREARKWNAADIIKTVRTNRWRGINARIRSAIARPAMFSLLVVVHLTLNLADWTSN